MSVFSVGVLDILGEVQQHVSDDEVLWDWLVAENAEASFQREVLVTAPEGYVFLNNALVKFCPSHEDVREFPGEWPTLSKRAYVRSGPFLPGKAHMMLHELSDVLTYVSEEEFAALNLDESRVRLFISSTRESGLLASKNLEKANNDYIWHPTGRTGRLPSTLHGRG